MLLRLFVSAIFEMMKYVVASRNAKKIEEFKAIAPDIEWLSLEDIQFHDEIPEPFDTFDENAFTKAQTVFQFCGLPTVSDDSGLCVTALNNAPGVHSAYYGGEHGNAEKNIAKLLHEMKDKEERHAFFVSVICLVDDNGPKYFHGYCHGQITHAIVGSAGFGYDPIFIPDGFLQTFAAMKSEEKNNISHRFKSLQAFKNYLHQKV